MPAVLLLCLLLCMNRYRGPYRATVAFLVLYLVGEYAFRHGIEILLFISTLMAGLVLFDQKSSTEFYSNTIEIN